MRRLFAILLLIVVSFQGAWAAAANYCEHEPGSAVQAHFGHHAHIHISVDENDKSPDAKFAHADCLVCHMAAMNAVFAEGLSSPGGMLSVALTFAPAQDLFESGPASLPERPKWLRLA